MLLDIPSLDDIDLRILQALQNDGRISNRQLAERVALSPAPCWRRLRALEENDVIQRYAALVDPAKVGLSILAFAHVSLENHHSETVAEFDALIHERPEVLECHSTSGDYDYMLKIIVADMAAYETFLSDELLQIPAVRTVNTSFSLRQKKLTTQLPLV